MYPRSALTVQYVRVLVSCGSSWSSEDDCIATGSRDQSVKLWAVNITGERAPPVAEAEAEAVADGERKLGVEGGEGGRGSSPGWEQVTMELTLVSIRY